MDRRPAISEAAALAMRLHHLAPSLACALALLPACRPRNQPQPISPNPVHHEPAPPIAAPPPIATTPPPPPPTPTLPRGECDPYRDLEDRRGGELLVPAHPSKPADYRGGGRLRTHIDGDLDAGKQRIWIGPPVPAFVPLTEATAELFLLDRDGDTFVATYRAPYESGSCPLYDARNATNCEYHVKAFDKCGAPLWSVHLNTFFSRRDHIELQDIHHDAGVLYFNEACQSYSREAGGKCSALVAIDPKAGKLLWRTPHLRSNGEFILHMDYLVSIYGFSGGEKPYVHVIRKRDGKVLIRKRIENANWDLQIHPDGHLQTAAFGPRSIHYTMIGWDTGKPVLEYAHD